MLFLDNGFGFGMGVVGGETSPLALGKEIRRDIPVRRRR